MFWRELRDLRNHRRIALITATILRLRQLTFLLLLAFAAALSAMARTKTRTSVSSSDPTTTVTLPASEVPEPTTFSDGLPLPKLFVFDLDYSLWNFWCDTHVYGRITGSPDNGLTAKDSHGGTYGFYNDVAALLLSLQSRGIMIGAASRTSAEETAKQLLTTLRVPSTKDAGEAPTAWSLFDYREIYPGSKTTHFQKIHRKSGIPYSEMLFFDDESRNKNVEELGVVMQLVWDGVTRAEVDKGVESWRKRNGRTERESGRE